MKSRTKNLTVTKSLRLSSGRRLAQPSKPIKELSLLNKIAKVTEDLQMLRSRLSNAGNNLATVGTHRILALENDLEQLWELRRQEQAAPLRQTVLSDEEGKLVSFSVGRRGN